MNNDYFFWEKIEQRAFSTNNAILKEGTWSRFSSQERNKHIYIFGCSEAGREVKERLKDSYTIVGFLDNSKEKQGMLYDGLPVYSPDQIVPELSQERDTILIVLRKSTEVVAAQLEELGFDNFYSIGVILSDIEPYKSFIEEIEDVRKRELEDIIMLESTNDVDGNTGALYWYLKEKGVGYKFLWVFKRENSSALLKGTDDIWICPSSSLDDYKKYIYYLNVAKWQMWDNLALPKMREGQINVFLQHAGLGYKKIDKFFDTPDYVDYWLCVNEFVKDMIQPSFHMPDSVETIYGTYPRNDVLLDGEWDELKKITNSKYHKVIMWTPTFRNSKYFERNDSDLEYPYGIPIIYNIDDLNGLNYFLKDNNTLMIIKPHPSQKMERLTEALSNIIIMDNENYGDVHIYKLLTQVDAMISDYSSIVFDYMLLDRPIAWAIEDLDHYKLNFLMSDPLEYMPGEKLYTLNDVIGFIKNVIEGKDLYKKERDTICKKVNADKSIYGCRNVVEKLGLLK